MGHPAPKVYIDNVLMDDHALSNHPVLAGLTLDFGIDSDLDMADTDMCSFDLLIRESEDLGFLDLGKTIAVYHQPIGTESDFTYFVGRIQRLAAQPDPKIDGSLRVSITAADLNTDLQSITVNGVNAAAARAADRVGHFNSNAWLSEPGWTFASYDTRWPELMHSELHYDSVKYLDLLDAFLRGQIMRRRNHSYYKPGRGTTKRIVAFQDSSQDTRADQLVHFKDSPRWGARVGAPYGPGSVVYQIGSNNVHRDAGWTKETDDVITEVKLDLVKPSEYDNDKAVWKESETREVVSRDYLDTTAARARYGTRITSMTTDLPYETTTSTFLKPIFEHWISETSPWRAKNVSIVDTDKMHITNIGYLLAPTSRYSVLLAIRDLMDNRPDPGNADLRGFVIGGNAEWDGNKWHINLTLGRVPGLGEPGDYWTCELIASSPEFQGGQCDTVGDYLTCNDFKRIGVPD